MSEPAVPASNRARNVRRLLAPRHIAVFGGDWAAEAVRQSRRIGFRGEIWPVHPRHDTVEGLRCYRSVAELPEAPDASFIAVPRESVPGLVEALAARGGGGVVCFSSGFAETGGEGAVLQRRLVEAAGDMAIVGPNCYGILNLLDGAALWPDQHGARPVERGAAIITQSGNLGLNLTMQRRALPLAYLVSVGNLAVTGIDELVDALLDDPRVNAIGLHLEGLEDVAGFSRTAVKALERRVPLVVLKSGSSELGAETTVSHTSSLAGADDLYEALFRRFGIARVRDPASLLETLKFLCVHGALPGRRLVSASCSGGEATLVADVAEPLGLALPGIPDAVRQRLLQVLGDRVSIANPLDYHTYIWGDLDAQAEVFRAVLACRFDAHLLVLDLPREDRCSTGPWTTTLEAFIAARRELGAGARASVVASMPEGLSESVGDRLLAEGIAPMQGIRECLEAVVAAAGIGAAQARAAFITPLPAAVAPREGEVRTLDEWAGKRALAEFGLAVPEGEIAGAGEVPAAAERLGYPVAVKVLSAALVHKTEAGGVALDLRDADAVRNAITSMRHLSECFLVERMAAQPVAELIIGVRRDGQFGLALTLGAGGILVELLKDAATMLLPASDEEIGRALASLRVYPLLEGYRRRPAGDIAAVKRAIAAVVGYAEANRDRLQELDVNPLRVLPDGRGAVAVDVMVRLYDV
ncbi:MAG: acetate--CoA ligase family protein [Gammaproteobacteria bacterium]|nr:acetate--CoA ligase family protein [Gammaproteobacteria bacterium]